MLSRRVVPKGIFPSANFPRVFSQLVTSQMCILISCNFQVTALGLLAHSSRSAPPPHCRRPNLTTFGKMTLGKLHKRKFIIWKTVTWEITLGKMPFGKHLTPFIYPWLYLGNERKREIEIMLSRFSEQNSSWRDSLFFLNHSSNHYVSMYCLTILEQVSLSSVLSF